MPVILATQGAEIRKIVVPSQPGQIVLPDPFSKKAHQKKKKRVGGVAQGIGPEFKPIPQEKRKINMSSIYVFT
jgi:hypothetical protein